MCLLCGYLVADVDWTESGPATEAPGRSSQETERRQARFKRLRIVNRVLATYQLSAHDDLSGTQYVITNGKGSSEVVPSLDLLWPAAERLAYKPLDPLEERLLDRLESRAPA